MNQNENKPKNNDNKAGDIFLTLKYFLFVMIEIFFVCPLQWEIYCMFTQILLQNQPSLAINNPSKTKSVFTFNLYQE